MAFSSLVLVTVYFRLEWKAPEDNGGSQIVQYEVCRQQHCFQLVHFNIFISNTYLYFYHCLQSTIQALRILRQLSSFTYKITSLP